jgi:glycosyltransferase involved in cell wall biosynthesis
VKILHLYSNHKWTGPAELCLLWAQAFPEARLAPAGFVHRGMEHAIAGRAIELGIPLLRGLQLRRHFHLTSILKDVGTLASWIDEGEVDLLHCHQPGDHFLAALALQVAQRRIPLLRSLWGEGDLRPGPRQWIAFSATRAFSVPLPRLRSRLGALGNQPLFLTPPPVDLTLPDLVPRREARAKLRARLGLQKGTPIVVLTARIQRRRRWGLAWETFAALHRELPEARLVILGRPDEGVLAEVCERPLAALGLQDVVLFPGYLRGEAYAETLAGADAFLFLVPGSDATCRALREAMLFGLPVVVPEHPGFADLIDPGVNGLLTAAEPEALAAALRLVLQDPTLARRLGESAAAQVRAWDTQGKTHLRELYAHLAPPSEARP